MIPIKKNLILNEFAKEILDLIDERIQGYYQEINECENQSSPYFNQQLGALDELNYIKKEIKEILN